MPTIAEATSPDAPQISPAAAGPVLPWLFSLTLFVSSSLLFVVQPMVARMILPLLGGTPSIWNTCMVFFQAALLAGYAYAHASTAWLGTRRQTVVQFAVLAVPLFMLPIAISGSLARQGHSATHPAFWLLGVLVALVGVPFFAVATTTPLLQAWFARTGHPAGRDPYFLYAASNLGSMAGLLGYPLLVEPNLTLAGQSRLWSIGYGLLAALTAVCALAVWWAGAGEPAWIAAERRSGADSRLAPKEVLSWILLAFLPSSLLMGVTTFISTDLASFPLLWVIPLALYLLTFTLVFARRPLFSHRLVLLLAPAAICVLVVAICLDTLHVLAIPIHLVGFFLAALACHGELARRRPPASQLTAFYLALSVGGVLGGLFNALLAPVLFSRPLEYPLAIMLVAAVLPARVEWWPLRSGFLGARVFDLVLPAGLGGLVYGLIETQKHNPDGTTATVMWCVAGLAAYGLHRRPRRFVLAIGALLAVGLMHERGDLLCRDRSFFGILEVREFPPRPRHQLVHGSTLHGLQDLDEAHRRVPLTYYHRTGPLGDIVAAFQASRAPRRVGVVGLGTGSIVAYAEPGERWTYFEIDPNVVRIARDPTLFTYLTGFRGDALEIVLGDARLRLDDSADPTFGLLVLDAFSSDAIPVHLVTREALGVYRRRLAETGLLAYHISNRYLDLEPVLAALARDCGLACRICSDRELSDDEQLEGKTASVWMVLAEHEADLGDLATSPRWKPPRVRPSVRAWTDDFSNIIGSLRIRLP